MFDGKASRRVIFEQAPRFLDGVIDGIGASGGCAFNNRGGIRLYVGILPERVCSNEMFVKKAGGADSQLVAGRLDRGDAGSAVYGARVVAMTKQGEFMRDIDAEALRLEPDQGRHFVMYTPDCRWFRQVEKELFKCRFIVACDNMLRMQTGIDFHVFEDSPFQSVLFRQMPEENCALGASGVDL